MRLIVVGAGIYGAVAAWEARRRGHDVVLVERNPTPGPGGASFDEHRLIRRFYPADTAYAAMIGPAFDAWDAVFDDLGARHLVETGVLAVSRGADDGERLIDSLAASPWPCERMDGPEAERRYAFLAPGWTRRAAFSPEGGALLADRILTGLLARFRASGGTVRDGVEVRSVDAAAGAVVLATGERLLGDAVVVAAGAWAGRLFPHLAPLLRPWWTSAVFLEPPPELAAAWAAAPGLVDTGGAVDGYVLPPVAGTRLKMGAAVYRRPILETPDLIGPALPPEWFRDVFAGAFRDLDRHRVLEVRHFPYVFTPDHRFHAERRGRCWILSCCSGHGFKFGAVIGRRAVDAVEGRVSAEAFAAWTAGRA